MALVGAFALLSCGAGGEAPQPTTVAAPEVPFQRGVSWVATPQVVESAQLGRLPLIGVTHIVQTPFGWQRRHDSPHVGLQTEKVFWGETDEGLEVTTRLAREHGVATLLKPHVWLTRADGKWRSDIAMASEADWENWFASYRLFILHYAQLAERLGIEGLAIGTELHATVRERPEDWRRIIREVRAVYGGQLTYAANWWKEYEDVTFWDELDFIGIQGYFPLSEKRWPSDEELDRGWRPHLEAIERVQKKFDKPVVFTEIGYRSSPDAAIEPWKWADSRSTDLSLYDSDVQARCYQAFFRALWHQPWFRGAYIWKWHPHFEFAGGVGDIEFTPQNKPAEAVLAEWYRKERGAPKDRRPPR